MREPRITPELLAWLELYFPDRMVDPDIDEREVWLRCGQVSVVRFLRQTMTNQENLGVEEI